MDSEARIVVSSAQPNALDSLFLQQSLTLVTMLPKGFVEERNTLLKLCLSSVSSFFASIALPLAPLLANAQLDGTFLRRPQEYCVE